MRHYKCQNTGLTVSLNEKDPKLFLPQNDDFIVLDEWHLVQRDASSTYQASFSLPVYVQVTQHGCCMTHTGSLWTWRPLSQRRKAWRWTWLPLKRRRRQHRWGDESEWNILIFTGCSVRWNYWAVFCVLSQGHTILTCVSVLQYCTISQNQESCTCCLNKPPFTL